jgi:hypothetical protein
MSERRSRRPNALKHGAFSAVELFPWEDANEFEELRRGLMEEHQPEGPLQEDCVNSILSCMWRKRRLRDKRKLDIAAALERVENRVLWEEPPPLFETSREKTLHALRERRPHPGPRPRDDYQQLLGFSASLFGEKSKSLLKLSLSMLRAEFSAHLNEKVPCEFESTYQWIAAVKKEVDSVLLPMVRSRAPQSNVYFETAAAFLTDDRILEDLAIEDRFDAGIDRALKRLWQLQLARRFDGPKEPKLIDGKSPKQLEYCNSIAREKKE